MLIHVLVSTIYILYSPALITILELYYHYLFEKLERPLRVPHTNDAGETKLLRLSHPHPGLPPLYLPWDTAGQRLGIVTVMAVPPQLPSFLQTTSMIWLLAALYYHLSYLFFIYLSNITKPHKVLPFSACSYSLLNITFLYLLLLIRIDIPTYQKSYDISPKLVGHQSPKTLVG